VAGTDAIGPYGVVFGIFGSKPLPHPLPQIVAEFFGVQFADTLKYIINRPATESNSFLASIARHSS
jgi:hypothetical protein